MLGQKEFLQLSVYAETIAELERFAAAHCMFSVGAICYNSQFIIEYNRLQASFTVNDAVTHRFIRRCHSFEELERGLNDGMYNL